MRITLLFASIIFNAIGRNETAGVPMRFCSARVGWSRPAGSPVRGPAAQPPGRAPGPFRPARCRRRYPPSEGGSRHPRGPRAPPPLAARRGAASPRPAPPRGGPFPSRGAGARPPPAAPAAPLPRPQPTPLLPLPPPSPPRSGLARPRADTAPAAAAAPSPPAGFSGTAPPRAAHTSASPPPRPPPAADVWLCPAENSAPRRMRRLSAARRRRRWWRLRAPGGWRDAPVRRWWRRSPCCCCRPSSSGISPPSTPERSSAAPPAARSGTAAAPPPAANTARSRTAAGPAPCTGRRWYVRELRGAAVGVRGGAGRRSPRSPPSGGDRGRGAAELRLGAARSPRAEGSLRAPVCFFHLKPRGSRSLSPGSARPGRLRATRFNVTMPLPIERVGFLNAFFFPACFSFCKPGPLGPRSVRFPPRFGAFRRSSGAPPVQLAPCSCCGLRASRHEVVRCPLGSRAALSVPGFLFASREGKQLRVGAGREGARGPLLEGSAVRSSCARCDCSEPCPGRRSSLCVAVCWYVPLWEV